jgi:hypothetical protein
MGLKLSTVAKVLQRQSPEQYRAAVKMCEPMLVRKDLIPAIYAKMKELYPNEDKTDYSIIFAICVYQAYSPASLIDGVVCRAPNGIRSPMCEVMQWNDAPVVNYYQTIGKVYQKVPSYQAKVSSILMGFEQFSIKSQQTELF